MRKYLVLSMMLGFLATPLIAEETKPITTPAKTESGVVASQSEKSGAQKAAPVVKPVMKKAKKRTKKVQ